MFFVNLGIVYIFLIVGMFGLVFGFFILGWYVLEILGVILFVFGVIGMGYFGYDVVGFVFMIWCDIFYSGGFDFDVWFFYDSWIG